MDPSTSRRSRRTTNTVRHKPVVLFGEATRRPAAWRNASATTTTDACASTKASGMSSREPSANRKQPCCTVSSRVFGISAWREAHHDARARRPQRHASNARQRRSRIGPGDRRVQCSTRERRWDEVQSGRGKRGEEMLAIHHPLPHLLSSSPLSHAHALTPRRTSSS